MKRYSVRSGKYTHVEFLHLFQVTIFSDVISEMGQ